VDRFGFRRASILSDVTAGAAVAAIPLLFWADVLPFWLLLALAFLISVFNAPGDLARRALVPTLAGWAAMPLERFRGSPWLRVTVGTEAQNARFLAALEEVLGAVPGEESAC